MVTLGKPIGNGFPMGAVILTRPLADAFDNGMQYFATCGACTASSAAGAHLPSTDLLRRLALLTLMCCCRLATKRARVTCRALPGTAYLPYR